MEAAMVKTKIIVPITCLVLISVAIISSIFLITHQRELNVAMEQERKMGELYFLLSHGQVDTEDALETNHAVIGLAHLRSRGFSQERAFEVWMDEDHPQREAVRNLAMDGREWREFEYGLRKTFAAYFNELSAKFPDLTSHQMLLENIPLPVLREVIALYEVDNPPKPRPVAEIEQETDRGGVLRTLIVDEISLTL
jgi:hypothetical protein